LEASITSRFLGEVPEELVEDLNPRNRVRQVDLTSERHEVRETAKRNLYTGKTYNSVENIQQFFNDRAGGQQVKPTAPAPVAAPKSVAAPAPVARPAAAPPAPVRTAAPAVGKKKTGFRSGATILHPKYGRGTVLRREGDGEDAKLTVSFPGYGLKKLIEKYAGIQEE
jgi:DNA helicase-2/ATP-dependent DNA helicase PcrA